MIDMTDILRNGDETFRYRLLSRMKTDCDYFLGYGNRSERHLWAQTVKDQIECMKALWNSFPADKKPEWLTYAQLLDYEKKMMPEKVPLDQQISDAAERSAAASERVSAPSQTVEH